MLPDGREIRFLDRIPARLAIKQALAQACRQPNPSSSRPVAVIPGFIEEINYRRPKSASPAPDRKGVRGRFVPYQHRFRASAQMFALADGSVLIKPTARGKKLWVAADRQGYAR